MKPMLVEQLPSENFTLPLVVLSHDFSQSGSLGRSYKVWSWAGVGVSTITPSGCIACRRARRRASVRALKCSVISRSFDFLLAQMIIFPVDGPLVKLCELKISRFD